MDFSSFLNIEHGEKLEVLRREMENFELWTASGHPSLLLLNLMGPKISNVIDHPMFWDSTKRPLFLCDASDKPQLEQFASNLRKEIHMGATWILPGHKDWHKMVDGDILLNLFAHELGVQHRFAHVVSFLRAIRNRFNHHIETPHLQQIEGPSPDGFDAYYSSRFPALLMHVYLVMYRNRGGEEVFGKYFTFFID
ncbi:serine/threonine-protein kinase/endoribonuclease IRE1b-like [Rhodamnia argentea]|uniref:Serine/threonine-protein kinase/endoribonuclease IRE1b-like n=1 Tax=Rhodamnia argentea TaxID=178133 RepID=A0A8B8P8J8_9MYRT|nr:serine/threonine-protein kinase/endoribonuclease IRE1b-like [Rhodamnia argentea]